jgi:hypothetical protein
VLPGLEDQEMTREETKQDLHQLYTHWPKRMACDDRSMKAVQFYNWLISLDTGILSYGNFGDGVIYQNIAVWVEEWEKDPETHQIGQ